MWVRALVDRGADAFASCAGQAGRSDQLHSQVAFSACGERWMEPISLFDAFVLAVPWVRLLSTPGALRLWVV